MAAEVPIKDLVLDILFAMCNAVDEGRFSLELGQTILPTSTKYTALTLAL